MLAAMNQKTFAASTFQDVPCRRRRNPYCTSPDAENLPEEVFSSLKKASQAQADSEHYLVYDPVVAVAFADLVASAQGNERSLSSLDTLLRAVDSTAGVHGKMKWLTEATVHRQVFDDMGERVQMATQLEIDNMIDDIVPLTFGQLPLVGLSDRALYAMLEYVLPGAVVFVTTAAHPKMRSHGLRFVLVRKTHAQRLIALLHHRVLFTADSVLLLSPWAATAAGFRVLAEILSVRDTYLKEAVVTARDPQAKLTGGVWPVTVQPCQKGIRVLASFAAEY